MAYVGGWETKTIDQLKKRIVKKLILNDKNYKFNEIYKIVSHLYENIVVSKVT